MSLALNTAAIPRNLDMKDTLMRWAKGFDYRVARSGASFSLQTLLEHGFVVCLGRTERIRGLQFILQRVTNKSSSGFEAAVHEDRARNSFKHVGKQSVLVAPATLFLAA